MEQRDWLRVVGVNYNDLRGRAFNGYDLHLSLNERDDVSAIQYVVDKYSDTPSVKAFDKDEVIHQELRYLERKYSIPQLLMPYGRQLLQEEEEVMFCLDFEGRFYLNHQLVDLEEME